MDNDAYETEEPEQAGRHEQFEPSEQSGARPYDHFPAQVAVEYDADSAAMFAPEVLDPTLALLAELAGEGPALEFGVGTGRLALPLATRGVPVHGIDLSPAMLDALRAKPGAERIGVTVGDFATTRVPGAFSLVYLAFNTLGNLTTQDAQVACFANAAAHLAPGGRFLVELGVPPLRRMPPGPHLVPFHVDEESWGFDTLDPVTQAMTSHHVRTAADGRTTHRSLPFRYAWPAELDLMARLAGMRLAHRWSGFSRAPFTAESEAHVSVWELPTS